MAVEKQEFTIQREVAISKLTDTWEGFLQGTNPIDRESLELAAAQLAISLAEAAGNLPDYGLRERLEKSDIPYLSVRDMLLGGDERRFLSTAQIVIALTFNAARSSKLE